MKRASEKSIYRLILVGKTGSGKSATGNWILGRPDFNFIESANSVSRDISVSECTYLHDKKILVVDTPGIFDKTEPLFQWTNKIQDSMKFLSPGPHAFLIVLKAGKVTEDDERTFKMLTLMFGPNFFNHAILILTHIDQVKNTKQFLQDSEKYKGIKFMFDMCRRRIITINNKENDTEIIQRERDKLMLMVDELTNNGMQYYRDDPSVYKDSVNKLAKEWEMQELLQEYQEKMNLEETKGPKEMAVVYEKENMTIKLTEEELKSVREGAIWKTVASKFLHTAVTSFLKLPAAVMEAAASLLSGSTYAKETKSSDSLKDSVLKSEDRTKIVDNVSDRMVSRENRTLEENSEQADPDQAERTGFETCLHKLVHHLQISIKRKLNEKRMKCILRWKDMSYPDAIIQAVKEIDKAKTDKNWKECMQRVIATVEMIAKFPQNEIPEKQELLTYIYSYFSPTFVETGDCTTTIGYHDNDWICAMEKLLKTRPEAKYPYEAALLYFEIMMRYLAITESLENQESFKSRSLSAARKAKDQELQLYGTVLFVLVERIATRIDFGPAKQREYFFRLAFSMERSLQLAEYLEDRVATQAIQTILQEVEIRCKRPYPQEIDRWMRRKLSKKITYPWIIKREEQTFNPENELSEKTDDLASRLDGQSSKSFNIKYAISQGNAVCVQQYLENQEWEHEDDLLDCVNYSLTCCDSDGKQTMAKHFISWICKELTKSHEPYNVSVWAASIAKQYSTNTYLVLVCNYWDDVDQKFKDKCFFGLPVIYQEYNTVSDEEQYVQSSKTFSETALTPIDAMQANEIISKNADWLMNTYSNLEVIRPCHVRSALLEVKTETCIVLYCRMKGFIPFGECQFPTTLSAGVISFSVDVREGFYVPAMLQEGTEDQSDFQPFRMGYSMGPHDKEISATVGPFVQIGEHNVGFLTCAHAFGVPCNIQSALEMPVVQPANGEFASVNPVPADESICGYVDRIAFDIDPDHLVNVDAALIRLKPEKVPNKGRFARNLDRADPNRRQHLSFDNGEIMTKENVYDLSNHGGKIIKVGAASGLTSSNLFYNGRVAIRTREAELSHEHGHIFLPINEGTRCYVMKGQYLIRSRPGSVFLIAGDSGSGVFYIDQSQRLRCIGIAIGFLANTYEAVVTPIEDVLEALGLDEKALTLFNEHYIYQREERQ